MLVRQISRIVVRQIGVTSVGFSIGQESNQAVAGSGSVGRRKTAFRLMVARSRKQIVTGFPSDKRN